MTLEGISPESLLDDFSIWRETALFLDAEDGAHFSKLPLIEDDVLLRVETRHGLSQPYCYLQLSRHKLERIILNNYKLNKFTPIRR